MVKRKTTPEEREEYLRKKRATELPYKDSGRRLPMDMSFIDKKGEIVRPNKKDYQQAIERRDKYNAHNEAGELNDRYHSLISKYGKDSQQVYNFEVNKLGMHREGKPGRLEGSVAVIGLVSGLFFLSGNFTGNVVGNSFQTPSNILGIILFLVGIFGMFFYFKKDKL